MSLNKQKTKIVHVQLMPLLSGVQRVSLQEIERLPKNEYEISVICKEPGPLVDGLREDINKFYIPSLCREISLINDLRSLYLLYKNFKREKYDIVHTHSSKTGVLGRVAAKLAGVPCIIHTVHGFAFESAKRSYVRLLYRILERIGAKCSTKIICLHEDDKKICQTILKISSDKIEVIPNGVDVEKYTPCESKAQCKKNISGVDDESIVYTMVGRLWPQKNPMYFAEVAKYIISNNLLPNAIFVIVGDGELATELKKYITRDTAKKILLLGWRDDIHDILKASDVFVLPSRWEGMPLAILEAQSTGLPCIVSNINGNKTLVTHGVDGYLIELNDINTFITAVLDINKDGQYDKMSKECRKKVLKHYDINLRIKRIEKIYRDHVC